MKNIEKSVKRIILLQLNLKKEVLLNTFSLRYDLDLDQIEILNLIIMLERTFKINVSYSDFKKIFTIQDLINYIYNFKNKKNKD